MKLTEMHVIFRIGKLNFTFYYVPYFVSLITKESFGIDK